MSKTSKNIMRWVCPSQILPLRLNNRVPTVLFWHKNMLSFHSHCLSFNCPSMPIQIWQPLSLNKVIQLILCLDIITCLSYVWYHMYHLPPWHPKFHSVSFNNYIFNILYLPLRYQCLIYQGRSILVCDWLSANPLQTIGHCLSNNRILA